ncbi:magnesium/cobalt transporter CorA [Methanocaldococcus fervens]|uniref:Magnesium transport protein CorA n=1 Tax=Methanocaldococcus fervens (strain DSM 4213 / JCM 15782 / AG86) TaxID=573064 RepID=C7P932_METFA|nr:magnesium/cobalt transporter CorA [Methanocaldococcus fervens]ACV25064.1 magnesium and cobalt transport protein CorA [Methanocaldococcus fervens AG86]
MITVIAISKEGSIVEPKFDEIKFEDYKLIWIDCYDPKDEELYKLSKKINISVSELQIGLDEQEIPRVEEEEDFYLIIYKAPLFEEDITTTSLGIYIRDNILLTIHSDKIKAIGRLHKLILTKKPRIVFERGIGFLLYHILNEITRSYSRILIGLEDELEELEDKLLIGYDREIMEGILSLRKTLVYFHKSLIANRDVLVLLKRKYLPITTREDRENFEDLYYDTLQLIDMSATYREVLTSMMDMTLSLENIKMNQIMKILTMVTTIFAVPMWITGIYGMNFTYLPLANNPQGFWIIMALMIITIITFVYIFKRSGWI